MRFADPSGRDLLGLGAFFVGGSFGLGGDGSLPPPPSPYIDNHEDPFDTVSPQPDLVTVVGDLSDFVGTDEGFSPAVLRNPLTESRNDTTPFIIHIDEPDTDKIIDSNGIILLHDQVVDPLIVDPLIGLNFINHNTFEEIVVVTERPKAGSLLTGNSVGGAASAPAPIAPRQTVTHGCWVNIRTGAVIFHQPTYADYFGGQYYTYEDPCDRKNR